MSILGYNDAPLVDHFDPPLWTIRWPSAEIRRRAAELAIELIEEPDRPVASTTFPPEVVPRGLTALPRGRWLTYRAGERVSNRATRWQRIGGSDMTVAPAVSDAARLCRRRQAANDHRP